MAQNQGEIKRIRLISTPKKPDASLYIIDF
jgi:hypothetical protein